MARGLFAAAGQQVDAQTVASALAHKTGERVGLAPVEGPSDVLEVPTSGLSRTVKAAGHTVQLRRMSQRKVQLAACPKGRVLLELWTRGMKNLTTLQIQHGVPKVKRVFKRRAFEPMTRASVTRMLSNISKGLG